MKSEESIGFERTVGPVNGSVASEPALRDGDVFGPFRVESQLGRGAMGEVYQVARLKERNAVALKVITAELMRDEQTVARFRQEAKTLCAVNHANIVAAFQVGEEGGRHWLTMKLCEGVEIAGADGRLRRARSLDEYAEACGGILAQAALLTVIEDVLSGLAYAHDRGIVHRDLKPANILLTRGASGRSFRALISDFGLVRIVGEERVSERAERSMGLSLTRAAAGDNAKAWLGNWAYMSPEQKRGQPATKASDLYAVGLLVYRLATGKDLGLEAASELNPDLVPEWDAFIGRALEDSPERRYASAQEMLAALEPIREAWERREAARLASEKPRSTRLSRMGLGLAAVVAVALLSFAVWTSLQSRRAAERAAAEQAAMQESAHGEKAEAAQRRLADTKVVANAEVARQAKERADAEAAHMAKEKAEAEAAASVTNVKALQFTEPKPGEIETIDLAGGVKLELIWCPAGSFTMGSSKSDANRNGDETQHRVTLTRGFWLGRYEVTQEQWESVMGSTPGQFKGVGFPVENVSWVDCQAFINALNAIIENRWQNSGQYKNQKLGNGNARLGIFRLPTEAEWEYACRAGETQPYVGNLSEIAWYEGNRGTTTQAVGQKRANAWGLHDMSGNVSEWCQDWYGDYPTVNVTNPIGPGSGSFRIIRGGSWCNPAKLCRSTFRNRNTPDLRLYVGLRLARDLDNEALGAIATEKTPRAGGGIVSEVQSNTASVTADEKRKTGVSSLTKTGSPVAVATNAIKTEAMALGDGVYMDFVWIPPGEFLMGSPPGEAGRIANEGPQHPVKLTAGFWMGKYEVTQRQYQQVMGENPSHFKNVGPDAPVESVDWNQAISFCGRLQAQLSEALRGKKIRLPTEVEWEYACRAGTVTRYNTGDQESDLASAGWFGTKGGGSTHEVGLKASNGWGLYDMHGNVWEWCWNAGRKYSAQARLDPHAVKGIHVIRGGAWNCRTNVCRSASRFFYGSAHRGPGSLGFRCVLADR